jgi:hypothetical protein
VIRPRTARGQSLQALAIYAVLWIVLVGREAVVDPAHTCACIGKGDPGLFTWALKWWPHAITTASNPFFTDLIWHPLQNNIPATTSVPALSLLVWPITATAGPLVSLNVLWLLSATLSAWFAYRLCRYVTGAWLPSLVGGYVFGFSTYELGQMLGHLHMTAIFLVPVAVELVLRRMDDAIGERRFVVLMALVFALQVGISTEVLFSGLMFGFATFVLAFWLVPDRRDAIRRAVPLILLAGGAAMLVVSPFLYEASRGLGLHTTVDWPITARIMSADPLNYVVPTKNTWIGGGAFDSLSNKFNSASGGLGTNLSESGAYVGLPLLALAGWYLVRTWSRPASRLALAALLLIFVASLGAFLHVAEPSSLPEHDYHRMIPLPWAALAYLPVFDHLLTVRFAMFFSLILGVVIAQALARPGRGTGLRWAVAGVGVLALLPSFNGPYWNGPASSTPFFEDGTYKRYLQRGEIVLTFPVLSGDGMAWQADTDFYFTQANGYLSGEVPPEAWNDPVLRNMLTPTGDGPIPPEQLPAAIRDYLERHHVGAVILDPTRAAAWEPILDEVHLRKDAVGGVVIYRTDM